MGRNHLDDYIRLGLPYDKLRKYKPIELKTSPIEEIEHSHRYKTDNQGSVIQLEIPSSKSRIDIYWLFVMIIIIISVISFLLFTENLSILKDIEPIEWIIIVLIFLIPTIITSLIYDIQDKHSFRIYFDVDSRYMWKNKNRYHITEDSGLCLSRTSEYDSSLYSWEMYFSDGLGQIIISRYSSINKEELILEHIGKYLAHKFGLQFELSIHD